MPRIQDSSLLVTSPGVETYLYFVLGFPMRDMCAFEIFEHEDELVALERATIEPIADVAWQRGHDLLLDAMVWRAQSHHVERLGYDAGDVERINRTAVRHTRRFAERWSAGRPSRNHIFVNGDIGPIGDGYRIEGELSIATARAHHQRQLDVLADAGVDAVSALTMTNVPEAIGIALAAEAAGLPCIISPTIETDGTIPDGTPLGDFVERVEDATGGSPLFYMVNCAHPIHLEPVLRRARDRGEPWLDRFRGFRANASKMSHEELDQSTELDRGHPEALASQMVHLHADFDLRLVGGCCGTDAEHVCNMALGIPAPGTTARALGAGS